MSFSSFILSLFCISPMSPDKWGRERRRRNYKCTEKANKRNPRLDVRISQSAHQWSESTEGIFRDSEAPAPPRKDLPRRRPVPPPKDPRAREEEHHRHSATASKPLPQTPRAQQAGPARSLTPVRVRSMAVPSKGKMERCIVEEVIAMIGKAFHHIPYAISGLSAMIHHGFNKRLPSRVTLICPFSCCDVICGWALACGMFPMQDEPNTFAVVTSDRKVRTITLRFLEFDFEKITTVRASGSGAKILSLSSIAGHIANDYVYELATASEVKQTVYAEDMRWVLRKMQWRREPMSHVTATSMTREEFYLPFTLSFPDMVDLFDHFGLTPAYDAEAFQDSPQPENDVHYVDDADGLTELATSVANTTITRRESFSSTESVSGEYTSPTSYASTSNPSLREGLERRRLEMYALDHPDKQQGDYWL